MSLHWSGGQVVKILVSADYLPQYRAVSSRVMIDEKSTEFQFEIESQKIGSSEDFSVSSQDGFVEISNAAVNEKDRKVLVNCKVRKTTFDLAKSSGAVLQRFRVADKTVMRNGDKSNVIEEVKATWKSPDREHWFPHEMTIDSELGAGIRKSWKLKFYWVVSGVDQAIFDPTEGGALRFNEVIDLVTSSAFNHQ